MLTERDYELLSAYIDGALNESEHTALESRLQAEDDLRRELESLRATLALIQGLPTLKAPRNFTLDARQVRRSSTRWLVFPASAAFSAISAAAATILIAISALLLSQSTRLIPTAGFGAVSNSQAQTGQQEIALNPTGTIIPSDIAQTATILSINGGLTFTAQAEETQKQFRAEMTATALSLVMGQANSASGGETDVNADQATGAALPAQAPTLEPEAADSALQFAPSEDNIPATAIIDGFLLQATALPDTTGGLAQYAATALPPAASVILEAAVTATPALELSRERVGTPTPLATPIPPVPATPIAAATLLPTVTLSALPPSPTPSPATQVAIAATTVPTSADEQTGVASPSILPLVLLVAGFALLIIAIGTTLARRRR